MDALAALRLLIEWGADEAVEDAPVDRLRADPPAAPVPGVRPTAAPPGAVAAAAVAAAAGSVDALRAAIAGFDGCALRDTATSLVFADGADGAGLMLVGDAPGAEDDRSGRPFAGPPGALLDRMLASIGLDRGQVVLTTLLPWRPPGGRPPSEAEMAICLPFLHRHIALRAPARLVLAGPLVLRALLGRGATMGRLRGAWASVAVPGLADPLPAMALPPPASVHTSPAARREAWAALRLLRRTLDA